MITLPEEVETLLLSITALISSLISIILSVFLIVKSLLARPKNNAIVHPQVLLITGGSDGIGRALAIAYSKQPRVKVIAICGRSRDKLETTKDLILKQSPSCQVITKQIDISNRSQIDEWILHVDDQHQIDVVYANAGVYGGVFLNNPAMDVQKRTHAMVDVNIAGLTNTVMPIATRFSQRRRGQIALMASLAGFQGLPLMMTYSATKAFVIRFGQLCREILARDNVAVNVITPGFIDTNLVNADGIDKKDLVGLAGPDDLVKVVLEGMKRDKAVIAFPSFMYFPSFLQYCMPAQVNALVSRLIFGKLHLPLSRCN